MKRSFLIYSVVPFAFISCTTNILESSENNMIQTKNSTNKITISDALNITDKLFKKTRSTSDYTIKYVLNNDDHSKIKIS